MAVEADVAAVSRDHIVQLYENDEELVDRVGQHLAESLRTGDVAIVVATSGRNHAFETLLAGAGIDVASARAQGSLISIDAESALSRFMVDGRPDPAGFEAVIGGTVRAAAGQGGRSVTAFGEMVGLLWEAGNVPAAIELEVLWNQLGHEVPFSLWCAYRASGEDAEDFAEVCALHSGVVGHEGGYDTRSFARSLRAPRAARHFVANVLRRWGRRNYVEDAVLIVSELTTNAVVHAKSAPTVSVSARNGAVCISVRDTDPTVLPVVEHPPPSSPHGRGLAVVAELASAWGSETDDDGKVVWAELRR